MNNDLERLLLDYQDMFEGGEIDFCEDHKVKEAVQLFRHRNQLSSARQIRQPRILYGALRAFFEGTLKGRELQEQISGMNDNRDDLSLLLDAVNYTIPQIEGRIEDLLTENPARFNQIANSVSHKLKSSFHDEDLQAYYEAFKERRVIDCDMPIVIELNKHLDVLMRLEGVKQSLKEGDIYGVCEDCHDLFKKAVDEENVRSGNLPAINTYIRMISQGQKAIRVLIKENINYVEENLLKGMFLDNLRDLITD